MRYNYSLQLFSSYGADLVMLMIMSLLTNRPRLMSQMVYTPSLFNRNLPYYNEKKEFY